MAIEFARVRYIKRSDGGNVCRSSAYNDRSDLLCKRTGERFYFAHRDPVLYKTVLLPEGADEKFCDPELLWNEAQAMEKRKDSQEARELLLALPTDVGLTLDDWKAMTEEFVNENFVSKGLAVQVDIHMPHKGEVNVHAHILISTRRLEGERFADHKARDLDPEIKTMKGGQKAVTEAERWGALWRDYQNLYFEREGLEIRVDDVGPYAQRHEGPVRLRTRPKDADARTEATREANVAALHDTDKLLETLTRQRATFTEMDIERLLRKHIEDPLERAGIRAQVLSHKDVIALHNRDSGAFTGRYTVKEVRDQEKEVIAAADKIATNRKAIKGRYAQAVAQEMTLDPEQDAAFLKATGTDGLVVIEGLAGTGKSHSLAAIREAHERAGWRVVGLAPTNAVVEDMRKSGFTESRTVHREIYWQEIKGQTLFEPWDRKTAIIVDEAAMLDTRIYSRLMRQAAETGAKVILAGDDRQLSSVERGGMFTALKERHGSVIISKVRRQEPDWQKVASADFADGRVAEGLRAYAEHGHVHWSKDIDESRTRLLSDWDQDSRENPEINRFVYAGTNAEVNVMNRLIRDIRVQRGEIRNEIEVDTVRGKLTFGAGDRIQFHGTDRQAGINNGALGTIEKIKEHEITVKTDAGKSVSFDPQNFKDFGLGYAGTVYRGQGKTQTEVYALYDNVFAWNARTAYVGLTRHTDRVELYVSRDLAPDEPALAQRMSRRMHDEPSLSWATEDEIQKTGKEKSGKERDDGKDSGNQSLPFAKDRERTSQASKGQESKTSLPFVKDRDPDKDRER